MATGEHVVELAEPEVVVRLSTTQLPACHPAPPPLLDSDPKDPKLPSVLSSASVADVSERPLQDLIENSPFLDTTSPITAYEMFKMCILLPWTLIRFVLLIIIMPFVWATTHVLMLGWDRSQPMSPARSWLIRTYLSFWSYMLLKCVYHFWYIPVRGREHLESAQQQRCIIVINHVSEIDPIAMVAILAPSAVAKAGVAKLPFFGAFATALQSLFVERKGFDKGNTAAVRTGGASLLAQRAGNARYPLLMVAPEGTTKCTQCLLRFSSGAFVAGHPVLPVLLRYKFSHCNPGWGASSPLWHVWRLMHQFNNSLSVEICPPYLPSEEERADARLYAANVRAWMGHALDDCPLVDAGVAEVSELYKRGVGVDRWGKRVVGA